MCVQPLANLGGWIHSPRCEPPIPSSPPLTRVFSPLIHPPKTAKGAVKVKVTPFLKLESCVNLGTLVWLLSGMVDMVCLWSSPLIYKNIVFWKVSHVWPVEDTFTQWYTSPVFGITYISSESNRSSFYKGNMLRTNLQKWKKSYFLTN